jgi:ribosomal protein L29
MSKTKKIFAAELRKKKETDLYKVLADTELQLKKKRLTQQTKEKKTVPDFGQERKLVARIKTVLAEKRILSSINKS